MICRIRSRKSISQGSIGVVSACSGATTIVTPNSIKANQEILKEYDSNFRNLEYKNKRKKH